MKPGFYSGLSNAEYHGGPGESKSLLDLVRRSPAHYRARMLAANDNTPKEETPAQRIGTAFHALLLEPQEFVRTYCLALRPQDVQLDGPLVESRDQLVAMVEELNKGRLPKLSTSGTKDDLVARIRQQEDSLPESLRASEAELQSRKLADLKDIISGWNETRPGLLPATGTMEVLAQTLADAGRPVTLWANVKAQWLANNASRVVLTQEEWDQLHQMRDAALAHPAARALLTGRPGVAEHSIYWTDPDTGLLCRCRPDFLRDDGVIVDVKTCEDASLEGFTRSIAKWRYHVQAAFYMDGIEQAQREVRAPDWCVPKPRAFVFLAVEKGARVVDGQALGVATYVLDSESLAAGRIEYTQDLLAVRDSQAANLWPGYSTTIESISLPAWKLKQTADAAA